MSGPSPQVPSEVTTPDESAERERLAALRRYRVLDTPPEAAFERAAALAARLFRAPIALVSLTDEDRQWFKACVGLAVREVDRSLAFCPHAVASGDVLVVPDATLDPRFAPSPLVAGEPGLRFYAGAPLLTPGGEALGTLCVMDTVPRPPLTREEEDTLRDLAAGVMSELELRRALGERARSERLRDAVLTSALDAVITMNGRGRVEEWNPAAERMFGYAREEALGRELEELIVPARLRGAHRRGLERLSRAGEGPPPGRRVEVPARRRGGEEFPCELAVTPLTLDGEPLFTAYLRDLSERRRAQEALSAGHNLLRAVVDSVPAAIFVKDRESRYLLINAAGAAHLGRPPGEILGRTPHDLFPAETARASRERDVEVLTTTRPLHREVSGLAPDGRERTFLSTRSVYRDGRGEVQGLIGISLDITSVRAAEATVREQNLRLEARVRERTREVEAAQLEILGRLAHAAEHRDDQTGDHVRRVARTAAALGRLLGLGEEEAALLEHAAPLHDLGKIGVPDAVLLKPGRLSPEEFEVVKAHAQIGADILSRGTSPLVLAAQEIALTHHERWDGTGYPRGLAGEAIPLSGRIVAVADVLDALTSERPYKRAWTLDEALRELRAQAGRQFDPRVVAALERLLLGGATPAPQGGLVSPLPLRRGARRHDGARGRTSARSVPPETARLSRGRDRQDPMTQTKDQPQPRPADQTPTEPTTEQTHTPRRRRGGRGRGAAGQGEGPAPAQLRHEEGQGPDQTRAGPAWQTLLGGRTPTPVQAEAIPVLLQGRDVITTARTGSGKTLAFLIPAAARGIGTSPTRGLRPEVLVITPTRELAVQIRDVARELGMPAGRITGGITPAQTRSEAGGKGLIVGTPGRLKDLITRGELSLAGLRYVVLDEADELLSLGFLKDVGDILNAAQSAVGGRALQIAMASATFPAAIRGVAERFMHDPARIDVAPARPAGDVQRSGDVLGGATGATHLLIHTTRADLLEVAARRTREALREPGGCVVIFCRTKALVKRRAEKLADLLPGEIVSPLQGNMDQKKREHTMGLLREGKSRVLVATDIAGRGIDLPEVRLVLHLDVASTAEDHVHRSGRTARAGRPGVNLVMLIPEQRALWQSVRRGLPTVLQPPLTPEEGVIDREIQEKQGRGSGNGVDDRGQGRGGSGRNTAGGGPQGQNRAAPRQEGQGQRPQERQARPGREAAQPAGVGGGRVGPQRPRGRGGRR